MPEQAISPMTRQGLDNSIEELSNEFHGVFSTETVKRVVDESYSMLADGALVTNFLPVLAHRFVRERLRAVAQAEGKIEKRLPELLFVCVHNAGRSQIAAALTDHLSSGAVLVRSAGSQPGGQVLPLVIQALSEVGVDATRAFPKPLSDEVVRAADVVVTMGCGDACPIYPGKRYEDWELPDPAGLSLDGVRKVRDEIRRRVNELIADLESVRASPRGDPNGSAE
jgi:arsenate reductase (thioredoxin)